jgi:hypothetical protein
LIREKTSQEFDVQEFFDQKVHAFQEVLAQIESEVDASAPPESEEVLQRLTRAFHESREDCRVAELQIGDDSQLLKQVQARFRDELAHWFDQSWFFDRAKRKPRGFAGDFEMLTGIYEQQPKATGIGGYLDQYLLNADLARGVRSRLDCVQKFLVDEVLRRATRVSILNVASGPGREFSSGFRTAPGSVALKCIDTDEAALEYLRTHVDPETSETLDVNCFRYNALKMTSPKTNIERFGESDIIYSVGLCDYIPDRYLVKILKGWRESVKRDGVVYVAFKDAPRYVPAEYQWHADWHFYQRTENDCRELFAQAGYDVTQIEMFRDETGIIMNFVARAPALRRIRMDEAESLPRPHLEAESDAVPASRFGHIVSGARLQH